MNILELIKVLFFGVVEGITEWLPISSTGHMILLDEFIRLDVSPEFMEMFLVVIQLGAIFAVVLLYWGKIFPLSYQKQSGIYLQQNVLKLWSKILVACIPAGIIGLLFDNILNAWFYNYQTVTISLIIFGIAFIVIEKVNKNKQARITNLETMSYRDALFVGFFQVIAAVFPGTSRSGATIIGGMMIGLSRVVAAEFTFLLAIPVMLGASVLKLVKFGFNFSTYELLLLGVGMVSAFFVSMIVIRFLMSYIKKKDFSFFGWYRIVLGCVIALYFMLA